MAKRALRVGRAVIGIVCVIPAIVLSPITYIFFGKAFVEDCVALIVFENGLK